MTQSDDKMMKDLEALMADLADCHECVADVEEDLRLTCAEEIASIQTLEEVIEASKAEMDAIKSRMREEYVTEHEDLEDAKRSVERAAASLKKFCHNMPLSALRKSRKVSGSGIAVSIGKVSTKVSYDPAVLNKFDWLRDVEVDGISVVTETVDAAALDRIVASGTRPGLEGVEEYRKEVKSRAPSVRITLDS